MYLFIDTNHVRFSQHRIRGHLVVSQIITRVVAFEDFVLKLLYYQVPEK